MGMKIGLVAFRYHAGVLQMYLDLCAAAGVEVDLFTSERLLRDVRRYFEPDHVPACRVLLNNGFPDAVFLRRIAEEAERLDALLFVELQFGARADWEIFYRLSSRFPVCAGVHDIVLEPGHEFIPRHRVFEKAAARMRGRVFDTVQRFVVHAPQIRERFSREVAPREVCYMPVYFRDRSFRRVPQGDPAPLRVCVPGSYTPTRRDYRLALNAVSRVLDGGCRVELKLAGHPTHRHRAEALDLFANFSSRYPGVLSWSAAYMEEAAYRLALESSDLILAPLAAPPPFHERWSFTGQTRRVYALDRHITAATYDAVRFQLPILYPSFYMPAAARHPGALVYETEDDLVEQVVTLANNRDALARLTADVICHAESFTPEQYAPALKAFMGF